MHSLVYIVPYFTLFFNTMVQSSPLPDERLTAFKFFIGPGPETAVQSIAFRPEDGLRFREKFEGKYGPRGRDLIERFGHGYGPGLPADLYPNNTITKPPRKKKNQIRNYFTTKESTSST